MTPRRLPFLAPLPMFVWAAAAFLVPLPAAEFHVSTTGDDSNPGSSGRPFRTLAAARDAARPFAGREPVTVYVADGTLHLPETLVFTPADSGSADAPVVYRARHEGRAVLSGGIALDLHWEPFRDAILRATTPPGLVIDQLFVNGMRQRMARYPNHDASRTTAAWQGFAADAFSKERAARWRNPAGGYIHAMHAGRWGGYHYRITGKLPDGGVTFEGGWQNNRQMGMHPEHRMVENVFEELDAPGEWFHDVSTNTIFVHPEAGLDLQRATVEVVRLRHLVEFRGEAAGPVRHVTLQGFIFRHTARTFMDTKEPLLRSDWTIYRGGAVVLTGTEDVSVLDCEFDQPGGNAVFVNGFNRRTLVRGCHIHDAGASGVCFVGFPSAVRNPLFEYGQTQDLATIDRRPGPKTDDYPADGAVEDCLIHGIGRVERQPAAVQISMSARIAVRDCSIYDCARAGINVSEGTWGGHVIERCDVFDTVLETHDHGSFNSWGRDRFWCSHHRNLSEPEIKKDPTLPYLDAVETTTIRDSRWRCDHGWDIDLDDGSSNYEIFNNLLLGGGLKFREGYGRRAFNNVIVNNGFHPHVWFDDSASELRGNILMRAHAPIGQPKGWGRLVDRNLFTREADRVRHLAEGCDPHSLSGDPQFIDPAAGDFRVRDRSPALALGFRNFPMDRFGVKKPSLRAVARQPAIPSLSDAPAGVPQPTSAPSASFWLGAPLHALVGEEFSAFGTRKENGGIQLIDVPTGSAAAAAGLRKNDVILAVNGMPTPDGRAFFAAVARAGDAALTLRVVRDQKAVDVPVTGAPFTTFEFAADSASLSRLRPPAATRGTWSSRHPTNNDPLMTLGDGKLAAGYGPVFSNGIRDGAYVLDLGRSVSIQSIRAWSFNQNGSRLPQRFTVYGSDATSFPGWNVADRATFRPLGTIDTTGITADEGADFLATSLQARAGKSLGSVRFVLWQVSPTTDRVENTAWQELAVEVEP